MHEIARMTAHETVQETFLALGVDMRKPGEMIEVQQDFAWTRTARLTVRKLRMNSIMVTIGLLVSGIAWAVWQAVIFARVGR